MVTRDLRLMNSYAWYKPQSKNNIQTKRNICQVIHRMNGVCPRSVRTPSMMYGHPIRVMTNFPFSGSHQSVLKVWLSPTSQHIRPIASAVNPQKHFMNGGSVAPSLWRYDSHHGRPKSRMRANAHLSFAKVEHPVLWSDEKDGQGRGPAHCFGFGACFSVRRRRG